MSARNASLTAILESLLPTLTEPVPGPLLSAASSLMLQSRQKISNLKGSEEPARDFICAYLACKRLTSTLNLPEINANPPVPKRTFNALVKQFEQALPQAAQRTPRKQRDEGVAATPSRSARKRDEVLVTPSRSTRRTPGKTPAKTPAKTPKSAMKKSTEDVPDTRKDKNKKAAEGVGRSRKRRKLDDGVEMVEESGESEIASTTRAARRGQAPEVGADVAADEDVMMASSPRSPTPLVESDEPLPRKRKTEAAQMGNMLQERVDWTSDKKMKSYGEWKKKMLDWIGEAEKRGVPA